MLDAVIWIMPRFLFFRVFFQCSNSCKNGHELSDRRAIKWSFCCYFPIAPELLVAEQKSVSISFTHRYSGRINCSCLELMFLELRMARHRVQIGRNAHLGNRGTKSRGPTILAHISSCTLDEGEGNAKMKNLPISCSEVLPALLNIARSRFCRVRCCL